MKIIQNKMKPDFDLILTGDTHEGAIAKHTEAFNELIAYVVDTPNTFMIHMGDVAEGRPRDHKYYDLRTMKRTSALPVQQYRNAKLEFEPAAKKGKILGIHAGNHDWAIADNYGDLLEAMCEDLNVTYATSTAIYQFMDKSGKNMFKHYATHYCRSARSNAGDIIRRRANVQESIKRRLAPMMGDCLSMSVAHVHLLEAIAPIETLYLTSTGKKLKQNYIKASDGRASFIPSDLRWYMVTGSFLRQFVMNESTYADRSQFPPAELGYLIMEVRGGTISDIKKVFV